MSIVLMLASKPMPNVRMAARRRVAVRPIQTLAEKNAAQSFASLKIGCELFCSRKSNWI